MSVENVKKFLERVESNKTLGQKLEKAKNELKRIDTNLKNYEHIINTKIIPIAKESGFDFTAKDFLDYVSEIFSKLDEKDLLNVSGGSLTKKGLVGLSFLLAFAHFAPNFIAGAEVKTQQSSQSSNSNQSTQAKASSKSTEFKPSIIKSHLPTALGGKSIEEQERDNLVNYMKKNHITNRTQVPKKDLPWFDKAVKSTGKKLVPNTINGTYYLDGTIPDESQINELNLIHKWYVAQKNEPQKQKQININFAALNLNSETAPENSSPIQNVTVNKRTEFSVKKSVVEIANKLYTLAGSAWQKISDLLSQNNNPTSETNPEVSTYNETSQNTIGELDFNLLPTRESFTENFIVPKTNFNNYDKDLFKTEYPDLTFKLLDLSSLEMPENISIPKDILIKNAGVNRDEPQSNELGAKQESSSNEAPSTNLASKNEAETIGPIINLGASSANINAANQPIVNPGTSSKDESTNAELAANAGASPESTAAATVNSGITPANENVATPPVVNPAASAPNEVTAAPVNPEPSSTNLNASTTSVPSSEASSTSTDEAEPVSPVSNSEGSSTNESTSKETKIVAETKKATPTKFANQANISSADLKAAVKMDSDGEVHGLDKQGKHHVLNGKKLFKVHYEAVDHNLPIKDQLSHLYNTLEKINSFDDLDDSRRFFVVDFSNIIKATYNAQNDTFIFANKEMNTKINEFCFKNGIRPKVGYSVNSDESLSSVQIIDRLAETIERANNLMANISNKYDFIEDIKKIVCAKDYDSEYGNFELPLNATQKDHENWNLVINFYQNNINDDDMRVTYWGRNSNLTDEENLDNLIRIGNRINSLQELNDEEGISSMSNFLTDLDYYASFIKYDPYLETLVFSNLPLNSKNIERARNFVNIYYNFLSQKLNYNDIKPSNYEKLELSDKVKFFSETFNDKMLRLIIELNRKSISAFHKDLSTLKEEYNEKFPSQLLEPENVSVSRQNTNNKSHASSTPNNKVKKYEEVPLPLVLGNRQKIIELLKSGTRIARNSNNNYNNSENYRGGRKGSKL